MALDARVILGIGEGCGRGRIRWEGKELGKELVHREIWKVEALDVCSSGGMNGWLRWSSSKPTPRSSINVGRVTLGQENRWILHLRMVGCERVVTGASQTKAL